MHPYARLGERVKSITISIVLVFIDTVISLPLWFHSLSSPVSRSQTAQDTFPSTAVLYVHVFHDDISRSGSPVLDEG